MSGLRDFGVYDWSGRPITTVQGTSIEDVAGYLRNERPVTRHDHKGLDLTVLLDTSGNQVGGELRRPITNTLEVQIVPVPT